MRFKKEEGFTLVELMVVVLIIGILVAVAIPVFNSASAAARARSCQANQRTLDGAIQQWKAAKETNNPSTINDLAAAKTAIGTYVKDWDKSTKCPGGTNPALTVTGGDFKCPTVDADNPHEYETAAAAGS